MSKKLLTISLDESTMDILEVLSKNSNKTNDSITEEALWLIFEKYKSFIINRIWTIKRSLFCLVV